VGPLDGFGFAGEYVGLSIQHVKQFKSSENSPDASRGSRWNFFELESGNKCVNGNNSDIP
jgi:hypothetical protein